MYEELKRRYYVTPTNYVELVKGYVHLLEEKQKEIGNEKMKLTSGLFKLEEASRIVKNWPLSLIKVKVS